MTIPTVTDDLLAEIEDSAKWATNDLWTTDGQSTVVSWSDQANRGYAVAKCEGPDQAHNAPFIAVCNPENMLAIVARLRQLEKDAGRWRHARKLLHCEEIKSAQESYQNWGGLCAESVCAETDAAIDQAMQGDV